MLEWTVHVDGVAVPVLEIGSGAPLLWLHGEAGRLQPQGLPHRLTDRHRVVVPEHPGFGETERIPWIRSMDDMALYFRHFLHEAGIEAPLVVAGHSLGGWVAAELAVWFSPLVDVLVLVAPLGLRLPERPVADIFMLEDDVLRELEWHDVRRAPAPADPSSVPHIRNLEMTAHLAWEPRLFDPRLAERLRWIDVPTLLVWGDHDRVVDTRYADEWASRIDGARKVVVPDAGHHPHIEQPEAFADAVLTAIEAARVPKEV